MRHRGNQLGFGTEPESVMVFIRGVWWISKASVELYCGCVETDICRAEGGRGWDEGPPALSVICQQSDDGQRLKELAEVEEIEEVQATQVY